MQYIVKSSVKHDGTIHKVNSVVEFDEETAKPLVEAGSIVKVSGEDEDEVLEDAGNAGAGDNGKPLTKKQKEAAEKKEAKEAEAAAKAAADAGNAGAGDKSKDL